MAALIDIAKRLGVSEATVSNALSGKGRMKPETRERILSEARKEGYQLRNPIKNVTRRVIIVTEDISKYTLSFISGATESALKAGLHWPVYNLDIWGHGLQRDPDANALRPLIADLMSSLEFRPSGILFISQYSRKIPGLFTGSTIPVVGIQTLECDASVYVNYDNQQGAHDAVRYLAQKGKRRIATLCGKIESYSSSERMIGYQRALVESSLLYHPKYIWLGDWEEDTGYQLAHKLLDMSEPPGRDLRSE